MKRHTVLNRIKFNKEKKFVMNGLKPEWFYSENRHTEGNGNQDQLIGLYYTKIT